MNSYVLDTNFFFNLQIESGYGTNPRHIIESMTMASEALQRSGKGAFYMPPRIVEEMETFISPTEGYYVRFMASVQVKSPDVSRVEFPGIAFYDLVEEIRHRSYRGLQIGEEEMGLAVKDMISVGELSHIEYQKTIGKHIATLRDRYRNATRVKFLDSVADLDLIILAKELDATVVSADEGVLIWARKFGVKEVSPHVLKAQLELLLSPQA